MDIEDTTLDVNVVMNLERSTSILYGTETSDFTHLQYDDSGGAGFYVTTVITIVVAT